jgi:hypothetical protein
LTPARELSSSAAAQALFGDSQFQKAGVQGFQAGIQHSHTSTLHQGLLDERALAVWFGF